MKDTLLAKGPRQQVARIEDMCDAHVSHKWLFHVDACAERVLAPHDLVVNVQDRLGNRSYTGEGGCRLRGTFLDSQLERGDVCNIAGRRLQRQSETA